MNLPLLTILTAATALDLLAQGTGVGIVNFNNVGTSLDRRIWVNGGQVGDGMLASGNNYQIALYAGPLGTFEFSLIQVGPSVGFLTGTAAGTFIGGQRTITGLSVNGGIVTLQARAWCTAGGIFPTYESAVVGMSPTGRGAPFELKTKDPNDSNEPVPVVGQSAGWRGFQFGGLGEETVCTPEPSTVALTVLGGAACLLFVRRKKGASR